MAGRSWVKVDPMQHMGLVHHAVARLHWRDQGGLTREDLAQAGAIGLVMAARRYDGRVGSFSSYAYPWIRGAIFDELRQRSGVVRTPRRRGDQAALAPLERVPELDMDLVPAPVVIPAHEAALLRRAIDRLPRLERHVVLCCYYHDRMQTEVAAELGCSRANVSLLLNRALDRLRHEVVVDGPSRLRVRSRREPGARGAPRVRPPGKRRRRAREPRARRGR